MKEQNKSNREIIDFLLNQNLLTCVRMFGEIIGYDKFKLNTDEIIEGMILNIVDEFRGFLFDLDLNTFDNDFNELVMNYKNNIIDKSKHEDNVSYLFGNLLNIYGKHFNVEVSLAGELEAREYLDENELEIWSRFNHDLLDGLYDILDMLTGRKLIVDGEHFINDIIIMSLWEFINYYNNRASDDAEREKDEYCLGYDEYVSCFKTLTMNRIHDEDYIDTVLQELFELQEELKLKDIN